LIIADIIGGHAEIFKIGIEKSTQESEKEPKR